MYISKLMDTDLSTFGTLSKGAKMRKKIVITISTISLLLTSVIQAQSGGYLQTKVTVQTENGAREFDSFESIIAAAKSGEIKVDEIRNSIALIQKALKYEQIKTQVKYTIAAGSIATLFVFSARARYYQGYAEKISMNQTYTKAERVDLANQASKLQAENMKKLVVIGFPAALAGLVVVMLPEDREKLSAELSALEGSLVVAEQLHRQMLESRELTR